MIRNAFVAAASFAAALALTSAAVAQGPRIDQAPAGQSPGPGGQQAPSGLGATEMPGATSEILGPEGSFRLQPDGVTWERFQSVRAIGVTCTEKACGGERVFCMIQVRTFDGVKPGAPVSAERAAEFGEGVIDNAPPELKVDYVAPFAEKEFGANPGQWAEVRAQGEAGDLRFGLFLTSAEKRLIAFNCVSPTAKWDENKPRFEGLLASLKVTK